ncbi:MAG: type IV secretory system conjugative DNA transfer family protein [Actinophytocola sp.]|uniref:type IV secretory system conjugative DNA transfer family protein n=1 Tax=Actinophytocola sp. TaxID=1872138 RepID=UPI003C7939CF
MSRRGASRREVVRHLRREEVAGLALIAVATVLAALGLAGQLTAWVTGYGWPSWRGVGMNPVLDVLADPAEPMRRWPDISSAQRPAAGLYWSVSGALLIAATVGAIAVVRIFRPRSRPGFASRREVASRLGEAALLKQAPRLRPSLTRTSPRPSALQVGTWRGRDVNTGLDCYSSIRQSTYVVGPSESGKTSCVVIPEALDHDGPLLATSSRADVMAATWQARADRGRALLFDPLRQATALPLLRWDPVRDCADPTVAMRRAQALMSSVDMNGVENGNAWKSRGQAILRNLLHAAAMSGGDIRTVLKWTFDQTAVEPAAILQRSALAPESWATLQFQAIQTPERQRAGYYMPIEGAMDCFMHPAVLDTCTPSPDEQFDTMSFFFDSARQSTVYLLAQRSQAVGVLDLLAALMEDILHHARDLGQFSENNRLDPALKLLVDEAPSTATLTQLPDLVADGGGRGIPTTMVVQDRAQAIDRWGMHPAQSMWGAATLRMVLPGVTGHDELREIASYVDEFDEEIPSFTRHAGTGSSEQFSLRTRPGMTPADARALPSCHSLLIAAGGLRPVLSELTPYWQRPDHTATAAAERRFYEALNEGRTLT